ncbi:hypothetical protein Cfor_06950 [Coptotermes formosanus]|uniref:DDE Tnp4 domain-containing protein n=1 Tax=Coptotermes formosanus TaxID=36987 RepID=A0A6L2PGB4_COPFO|nr:hypothetical protein Cfor_06950 [Coptotermes formosanus]
MKERDYSTRALSYRLGHSTVQSTVLETCDDIVKELKSGVMCISSNEDWEGISFDFWNIWNYPNCLAVLDGKHVTTITAPNSGSLYFNYNQISIVLLALVNVKYNFTAVDIGSYGKHNEGGIFAKWNLGKLQKTKPYTLRKI